MMKFHRFRSASVSGHRVSSVGDVSWQMWCCVHWVNQAGSQ